MSERRQGSEWADRVLREVTDWESGYAENLAAVAARAGQTPEEFERDLFARIAAAEVTSNCFTLTEIENWPQVPDDRRRHGAGCSFCSRLMDTMHLDAPHREGTFIAAALAAQRVEPAFDGQNAVPAFAGPQVTPIAVATPMPAHRLSGFATTGAGVVSAFLWLFRLFSKKKKSAVAHQNGA